MAACRRLINRDVGLVPRPTIVRSAGSIEAGRNVPRLGDAQA